MRIREVKIVGGELVLVADGGEELCLPDGIFKSEDGTWIKVGGRRIVEAFSPPDVETASPEEISDYLCELEEQIQTVGQMTQMQQFELQEAMQKQRLALQALSNTLKALHDTAMALIRRIR